MKTITFRNGDPMPLFGLGTYQSKANELHDAIISALKDGYRLIDCAAYYKNEEIIGAALQETFTSGLVKREELFITSKLWNNNHAPEHVEEALRKTLHDLRLDYLDLYLIHWPIALKHDIEYPRQASDLLSLEECPLTETWKAMEQKQAKGLCRHIGVSNFSIPKLKELIAVAKNKPEMNQVEMHPYLQQNELFRFCQSEGIYLTAYSPLGRNLPIKNKPGLTNEPIIIDLAKKYNCTPAQIIIAWGVQRGIVIIPKSVHPERIKENIKSLDINISPEDMTKIATLDSHTRMTDGSAWIFPDGPYTMKNIWDEK